MRQHIANSHLSQILTAFCLGRFTLFAVVVRFKAIGNVPIMKNNHFRITAANKFQSVIVFLRKELGWKQSDALVRLISA